MSSGFADNSFPGIISNLLKEGSTVQAFTHFTDNKYSDELFGNSWDLVPIVSHYLCEDYESKSIEVFKCCQKMIDIIAEVSKPEEVLLQFIEEIELANDDVKFLALLKPAKTVLLRIPDKRITSLGWCFNAIKHYLGKVETPEDQGFTEEERLLLDSDENVCRINNLYANLLVFCEIFVEELKNREEAGNVVERKQVLGKFLVELLGKPLAFLDMEMYKNTKSRARTMAEALTANFFALISDPFLFLEMRDGDVNSDLIKPNDLSLGIFYYLVLSQNVCFDCFPKIYAPVYILQNTLYYVNNLLGQNSQFAVEKGVHLAEAILKPVNVEQLSYLLLHSENHINFCKTICNIIVHHEGERVRKQSLQILHKYLWVFEHQGRFLLILNLLRHLTHSGLKGDIIMQYKGMITQEIGCGNLQNLSNFYKDHKLFDLLDEFTLLKNKEETDLVDSSDQVVSTLNFLRYLIIADTEDQTGIDFYVNTLETGYFKDLKVGILMAKEHYRLKIKEVTEEGGSPEKEESECEVSVTVSGKSLLELPVERKIEILNLSLTTLDVVDSLLSRVEECINLKKNNV